MKEGAAGVQAAEGKSFQGAAGDAEDFISDFPVAGRTAAYGAPTS